MARLVVIAALLLLTEGLESNIAVSQTPDYEGSVCRLDRRPFVTKSDRTDVQNVLLYATPPGGGWYLIQSNPGSSVVI